MENLNANDVVDTSFEAADTNNDGVISRAEHAAALKRTTSSDMSFRAPEVCHYITQPLVELY